jgi:hypothetical protein
LRYQWTAGILWLHPQASIDLCFMCSARARLSQPRSLPCGINSPCQQHVPQIPLPAVFPGHIASSAAKELQKHLYQNSKPQNWSSASTYHCVHALGACLLAGSMHIAEHAASSCRSPDNGPRHYNSGVVPEAGRSYDHPSIAVSASTCAASTDPHSQAAAHNAVELQLAQMNIPGHRAGKAT